MKIISPVAAVDDRRSHRKSILDPSAVIDRRYSRALLMATLLLLTACSRLTEANLEKIHNGMSIDEVKAILGKPGKTQSADMLGLKSTSFTYHSGSSEVKIVFINGKVMSSEGEFK